MRLASSGEATNVPIELLTVLPTQGSRCNFCTGKMRGCMYSCYASRATILYPRGEQTLAGYSRLGVVESPGEVSCHYLLHGVIAELVIVKPVQSH
jgi:hypothetical protein